jgi:membrane protease YdiL (CAAX protease family)
MEGYSMATMLESPRSDLRERWLSAAEFACAAWIVIGHNVFRIFPNEVPILAVIALVSAKLMRGGFAELGFRRPRSWRLVVALAVGATVLRLGLGAFVIEPVTAHFWPPIVGPKGVNEIPGHLGAALAALGIVWTFAAFGEEIGYRGFITGRGATALGGGRAAWIVAALASSLLFGYGHFYKGPAGVLDSGVAGLILASAYLLSGRCLWTAVLAHGLMDTVVLALTYFGLTD